MKKKKLLAAMVCGLMLGTAGIASAAPIFYDNFDAENGGTGVFNYSSFSNWTVGPGTVDLIGNGFFDFQPGNGLYVDLDGSSGQAGLMLSHAIYIPVAGEYTLSFQLAGSQRTPNDETVNVVAALGNYASIFNVASNQDFTTYTANLYLDNPGNLFLTFQNLGGDNMGALLDSVEVAAVPEPGMVMLLGTGLLGLALYGKRRKNA